MRTVVMPRLPATARTPTGWAGSLVPGPADPDRLDAGGAGGPRRSDGRTPRRLAADEPDRSPGDQTQLGELLEAAGDPGEHRARGDRPDDDVGRAPAERLGDLEGQRLRALGV